MTSTAWKDMERRVASLFGGIRNPVNGRGDQPDVVNGMLVVEVKLWANLPKRVVSALEQAERNCTPDKLPIAVIGQKYHSTNDALVVMRMREFIEWFDPKGGGESEGES